MNTWTADHRAASHFASDENALQSETLKFLLEGILSENSSNRALYEERTYGFLGHRELDRT